MGPHEHVSSVTNLTRTFMWYYPSVIVSVLAVFCLWAAPAQATEAAPSILIVHSYHQGFGWTDRVMGGMSSVLLKAKPDADIHVEYLDAKRINPTLTTRTIGSLFAEKYGVHKPDIVMTSDDAAYDFILGLRKDLFAGVPLVFCGVNDFISSRFAGQTGITGVAEVFDIKGTVDLALGLHPKAKALAVISDSTETGAINLARFRNVAPLFSRKVEISELAGLSTDELVTALKSLDEDSVIVNLSFFRDRLGKSYSAEEANTLIALSAKSPVYSCWDFYLVGGVVGGRMVSGKLQGEEAARMAVRILAGESVDAIPVMTESPNVPMFDYEQMRRFNMNLELLPPHAEVLNRPASFYERNKMLVWASLAVGILLLLLVIVQAISLVKRRRAEEQLRASQKLLAVSEARYRRLVDNVQDAIFLIDENGRIRDTNMLNCERLGYSFDELTSMAIWDIDIQATPENFAEVFAASTAGEGVTLRSHFRCKNGALQPFEIKVTGFIEEKQRYVLGVSRDMSDRIRAEEALHGSERKYRIIFEKSPLGVVYFDNAGTILDCNDKFVALMGSSKEKLIGFNPIRECAPGVQKYLEVALSGSPSIFEGSYTSITGAKTLYLRVVYNPVQFGAPSTEVIATLEDIGDRKRAEEALEKRMVALTRPLENNLNLSFDELFRLEDVQRLQDEFSSATGVASLITTPDGAPITKPSNFCDLCSLVRNTAKGQMNCQKSDAFIGRISSEGPVIRPCMSGGLWDAGAGISVGGQHVANWLIGQVRDEEHSEDAIRNYAREIGADEEAIVEAFNKVPSMSRKRFDQVAQVLYTLSKQLSDFAYQNVQQARFIAERKAAEELLRASELKHRVIFENSPLGMVYFNAQGTIVDCNEKFVELMGSSKEALIGFSSIRNSTPKMREALRPAIGGIPSVYEDLYTSITGGKTLFLRVIFNPVNYGASPTEVIATLEDITESRQLLELMVQNEKMISVGGLAAGMAHEINNPLGGILQGVQNLNRRLSSETPANYKDAEAAGCSLESIREYCRLRNVDRILEGIGECGKRAADIVSNMLNFSRKSERNTILVDPVSLVERAISLTESDYDLIRRYDSRKVAIEREFASGLPMVECSETEIVQVLFNIIRNATQALFQNVGIGEGGIIRVALNELEGSLVISVADNGPGMDSDVTRRVFDPFFTTKPPGEGTGLGLSVSYLIITRNHGGEIGVESTPGNGTIFIIRIPLRSGLVAQQ